MTAKFVQSVNVDLTVLRMGERGAGASSVTNSARCVARRRDDAAKIHRQAGAAGVDDAACAGRRQFGPARTVWPAPARAQHRPSARPGAAASSSSRTSSAPGPSSWHAVRHVLHDRQDVPSAGGAHSVRVASVRVIVEPPARVRQLAGRDVSFLRRAPDRCERITPSRRRRQQRRAARSRRSGRARSRSIAPGSGQSRRARRARREAVAPCCRCAVGDRDTSRSFQTCVARPQLRRAPRPGADRDSGARIGHAGGRRLALATLPASRQWVQT